MTALNKVIGSTQTRLNQLTKAMRGDPNSVTLLKERFLALREQVTNAAVKVDTLQRGLASMRDDTSNIAALARNVKDTALNFQRADSAVRLVNKALNDQYARMKEIGDAVSVSFDKKKLEEFYAKIEKSKNATEAQKMEVKALAEQVRILKNEHEKLDKARELASKIHEYRTMSAELKIAESELRSFATQVVETKEKLATFTDSGQRLERLGSEFRELRAESSSLDSQFRQLSSVVRKNSNDSKAYEKAIQTAAERIRNAARQVEVLQEQLKLRQSVTGVKNVTESMAKLKANVQEAREKTIQAEQALATYKAKVDTSRQSWDNLHRQIKTVLSRTTELTDRQRAFLGITKEEEAEYRALKAEIDGSAEKVRELGKKAAQAGEELKLAKALEAQKKLQGEFTESSARVTTLTTKAKAFGTAALNAARDFATGLGATLGPALMMTGMRVITAADQIDSAFRDMRKTVDGTEQDFERLHDAAVEFSRTHPVSADTILEIEAMGGQLGIAVDNLEAFAHTVSNLDIATNMNADEIAIDLGKLANVLHISNEEYDSFADSLVRLGNNFPAMESDIMNITTRFAGMSAIVGVLPDEVLAIATAATATGQKADAAGGALQRTFGRLEGAVAGVSDAMKNLDDMTEEDIEAFENAKDKLSAYADIAGVSSEKFAALWEDSERLEEGVSGTTSAFKLFIEGLKKIDESGGSVDATLQKLGITGVRDRQLLEGLTNTTNILDDALHQSKDAWGDAAKGIASGGDAAREAEKKAEGFSGKLQMLKNTAQTMGDAFANKLVPLLDTLLDLLRGAAKLIDDMDEGTATAIALFGAFAVALAPVMRMASQTAITFNAFKAAAVEAGIANKALALASKDAGTAIVLEEAAANKGGKSLKGFISNLNLAKAAAVGLAVAGIALLVKAIIDYHEEQVKVKKATDGMKDALYKTNEAARDSAEAFYAGGEAYNRCLDDVKRLTEEHARLYDEMAKSVKDTETSVQMMERYVDIVAKNNGVYADNRAESERLRHAVQKLNDEYGANLKLVEEDGALHVYAADGAYLEAKRLDDLVAAKRREIELNAIANMQSKLVEQRISDEMALAEAKKQTAIAQEMYNDALASGDDMVDEYRIQLERAIKDEQAIKDRLDGTNSSLAALEAKYTRASEATDEHGRHVEELAEKYPALASQLDQVSDRAFGDFVKALEGAGVSTEDLANLTETELLLMVDAWQGGTLSWSKSMSDAKDSMSDSAKEMYEKVGSNVQKMKDDSIRQISELTGISEAELRQLASDAGADSAAAMSNWVSNIRNAKERSGDAAELNADAVRDELQKAVDDAKTTGWNIGAGLARGLENSSYLAGIAGANIAKAALRAANVTADVNSPSKKTMWTGEMMGLGLVKGMEKEEDAVRRQGALLADLALGAGLAANSPSIGAMSDRAASHLGSTTNNTTNNSTANEYVNITLNVQAHDLKDMNTIDDFLTMVKRSRAQYA